MVQVKPLACSNLAKEAAIIPFPREDVTPPVTNIYLDITFLFAYKTVQPQKNGVGDEQSGRTKLQICPQLSEIFSVVIPHKRKSFYINDAKAFLIPFKRQISA